jgi:hypothetical protein
MTEAFFSFFISSVTIISFVVDDFVSVVHCWVHGVRHLVVGGFQTVRLVMFAVTALEGNWCLYGTWLVARLVPSVSIVLTYGVKYWVGMNS